MHGRLPAAHVVGRADVRIGWYDVVLPCWGDGAARGAIAQGEREGCVRPAAAAGEGDIGQPEF